MSVVVMGNGRCGTNLMLEILSGSSILKATGIPEDKNYFIRHKKYPKHILTKSDTNYCEYEDIKKTLDIDDDIKVIWMIRDPRDQCMSKIYRGSPGQDNKGTQPADDATFEGCIEDMLKMYNIIKNLNKSDKVLFVKMEDIISDIENETKKVCEWLKIDYEEKMINFIPRMRNLDKKKRYKSLDKNQVKLHTDWKNVYDGWFVKNNFPIEKLFNEIKMITEYLDYE